MQNLNINRVTKMLGIGFILQVVMQVIGKISLITDS